MSLRTTICTAGIFFAAVSAANAATIAVVPLGSTGTTAITIDGELVLNDYAQFQQETSTIQKAVIVLRSDGGSVIAAIEIGKLIRSRNFATLVPDNFRCASACALAWLGGTQRFMGANAEIGFHAAYDAKSGRESGAGNALVGAYLNEIGLPDSAVLYITYASPSSMTWLTQADAEKVGIEISPIHSDQSAKTEDEWSDFNPQPQEQPAHAKNEQFIEFPEQNATKVYDLGSVQILLPGKFSIMATTVDSPDVLRLRLRVHDALAAYCKRSDGEYEVPSDLFALGSPDMPIETIVVKTIKSEIDRKPFREATWSLPYKRLAYRFDSGKVDPSSVLYICNAGIDAITIAERNANARSEILSGHRQKEIYDCSHGLMALKLLDPDSRFEPTMDEVRGGYFRYYESLCMKVMRSEPFLSPE